MKRITLVGLLLLLACWAVPAQAKKCRPGTGCTAVLSVLDSGCSQKGCLTTPLTGDTASVTVTISGTFSATNSFEQSADYDSSWVASTGTPQPSGVSVTSTTNTGIWVFDVSSRTNFRVRCTAYTSGRAEITIVQSSAQLSSGTGVGGLSSLNALTTDAQLFAVGTTGNDFAVSSDTDTHTFNLPDASATKRGVVSTGAQSFAGNKTLTGDTSTNSMSTTGDGSQAGYTAYTEGVANAAVTDTVGFQAPTNVTTPFHFTLPAAPAAGVLKATNAAPSVISVGTVASSELAAVNTRRTCSITVGTDDAASVLADANIGPQGRVCFIPYAATVVEVTVSADDGTPNAIPAVNSAGSAASLVSSALATAASGGIACSNTGGTTGLDGATTCSSTLQNTTIAAGDWIELTSGTAGGTASRMSVAVTFTVN